MTTAITLDGSSLTIEQLVEIARDPAVRVERDPDTNARVDRSERLIQEIVEEYRRQYSALQKDPSAPIPATEYGVTTGFGEFKDKPVSPDDLEQLQRNLLLSHSVGVGENTTPDDLTNYFAPEVVRAALATRLNAFLKGHSGVRRRLVEIVQAMLNCGVVPLVPLRGSVGASGDLCPLSHLFSILLGEGRFYVVRTRDDLREARPHLRPASELLDVLRFELPHLTSEDLKPRFKEGLALVNGANFSAAMLALGVHDAERLAEAADTAAALTMEALCGCTRALDPKVHDVRGQIGQKDSAERIRNLLDGSTLVERAGAVQDAYSVRCAPQVHGASLDAIRFARSIAEREINAATDNPLFFPEEGQPWDLRYSANWPERYEGDKRLAYSAGNFHGQPLALAADFLTIAVSELANISERRTQMMLDGDHNRRLPENLTTRPGVNSGLMIAQYTAASIVSENKVLSHPASVDSITTGANTEDHVSMSTHAARKMRTVIANALAVLSIEHLVAAQAIDWRVGMRIDPRPPSPNGSASTVPSDDAESRAFETAVSGRAPEIAMALGRGTAAAYLRVRSLVGPVLFDRPLSEDIRKIRAALE
ncbi:MAG TPA: aromatic amino acid lyase [Thermoanaerobaculia bacterium]|nr:aromatic amino acid lyase [Thermoanaerobaculia bacterium]